MVSVVVTDGGSEVYNGTKRVLLVGSGSAFVGVVVSSMVVDVVVVSEDASAVFKRVVAGISLEINGSNRPRIVSEGGFGVVTS